MKKLFVLICVVAVIAASVIGGGWCYTAYQDQQKLNVAQGERIQALEEKLAEQQAKDIADDVLLADIQKKHADATANLAEKIEAAATNVDARFKWQGLVNNDLAATWTVMTGWKKEIEKRIEQEAARSYSRGFQSFGPLQGLR